MASFAKVFLLAVVVICISGTVIAQDLLGCGGFVKSSASIDFSKIEVKDSIEYQESSKIAG